MPLPGSFIDPKVYELWNNLGTFPPAPSAQQRMLADMQRERLDPFYNPSPEEWRRQMERHGYRVTDFLPNEQVYAATQVLLRDEGTGYTTPPPFPSIPPQKAKQEHMWDMLVLAARSSRYGE